MNEIWGKNEQEISHRGSLHVVSFPRCIRSIIQSKQKRHTAV